MENNKGNEKYKKEPPFKLIENDLVNVNFPIYHDPQKLASVVVKQI